MDLELTGKVAIVTGSSRGLGLASARALAVEGCCVTLCARTEDRLQHAAAEIRAALSEAEDPGGGPVKPTDRVLAVVADVSSAEGVQQVVDGTVARFGGLDILV